jgi:hypothetical protein
MGLTLPGELETLLNDLGFTWPEVDETQLFALGSQWTNLGATLAEISRGTDAAARQVGVGNEGAAVDAFLAKWAGGNAPARVLADASSGVEMGGAAIMLCAGVVLALKVNTIANLAILAVEIAEAIATAVPTFGASLAEIPVFKEVTQRILNAIINEAVNTLLG